MVTKKTTPLFLCSADRDPVAAENATGSTLEEAYNNYCEDFGRKNGPEDLYFYELRGPLLIQSKTEIREVVSSIKEV